jgi:LmbE family N-acetylglucosaminyl deacetylase
LRRERADVLTIYDVNGGYGHPDHVQVHRVGVRAAALAGTQVVLEATIDRDLLRRAVRLMRAARLGAHIALPALESSYSPRSEITHRIDVSRHIAAKRAALLAHASQASTDETDRTIAFLLRLPPPLFRLVLGNEWFVQRHTVRTRPLATDIFTALQEAPEWA